MTDTKPHKGWETSIDPISEMQYQGLESLHLGVKGYICCHENDDDDEVEKVKTSRCKLERIELKCNPGIKDAKVLVTEFYQVQKVTRILRKEGG